MSNINYQELLSQILYVVLTGILPILATFLVKFIQAKSQEVLVTIENEKAKKYLEAAVNAIGIAVTSVNQTYVDSLKQAGQFDDLSANTAKNLALNKAKELISEDSKKFIEMMYGDFDKYLENAIEAYVRNTKLVVTGK